MFLKQCVLILMALTLTWSLQAQTLNKLGQRINNCSNQTADQHTITISNIIKQQVKNLWEQDKLKQLVVANPSCFRVGTEVKLFLKNEEINYLGRAFITKIKLLSTKQLTYKDLTSYSPYIVKQFANKNANKSIAIFDIQITEKVAETFLHEQYQRLPTCFSSYSDWKKFKITNDKPQQVIKNITSGKRQAVIWNGTFNCYKIGVKAYLPKDQDDKPTGAVVPKQLYLTHYTNLSDDQAKILDEDLTQLKKRMAMNKDIDGGYTTMVVFDYVKPELQTPELN